MGSFSIYIPWKCNLIEDKNYQKREHIAVHVFIGRKILSVCPLRQWGELGSKKLGVLFYQCYGIRLSPLATDRAGHIPLKSSVTRRVQWIPQFYKMQHNQDCEVENDIILKQQTYKTQSSKLD